MATPLDASPPVPGVDPTGVDPATPHRSLVRSTYRAIGARTEVERHYECGALRLQHPRAPGCNAILVNTAGGIVAGDTLKVDLSCGPEASLTVSSAAAEKVYRSDGVAASVTTRLHLASASFVAWLPQETILFDGARFERRLEVDLAADATFVAAEILIFGRVAHGEHTISGAFRDSWRVRRGGHLVFADETRLDGTIGKTLQRAAVANGARTCATLIVAGPSTFALLDQIRAAFPSRGADPRVSPLVEGGASLRDGIIVARLLAPSIEPLRRTVAAVLGTINGVRMPRTWS